MGYTTGNSALRQAARHPTGIAFSTCGTIKQKRRVGLRMPGPNPESATSLVAAIDSPRAAMPNPKQGERPTAYADRVGEWYVTGKSDHYRKKHGLFLTPVGTADFMAQQITANARQLKILDPAAGAGVLCCAAIETLVSRQTKTDVIKLVAYEVDESLILPLRTVLDYLVTWCQQIRGVLVTVRVEAADFILANAESTRSNGLFCSAAEAKAFDVVIANHPISRSENRTREPPPFQKLFTVNRISTLYLWRSVLLCCGRAAILFYNPAQFRIRSLLPSVPYGFLQHDSTVVHSCFSLPPTSISPGCSVAGKHYPLRVASGPLASERWSRFAHNLNQRGGGRHVRWGPSRSFD